LFESIDLLAQQRGSIFPVSYHADDDGDRRNEEEDSTANCRWIEI
jgi:hypothetical protein